MINRMKLWLLPVLAGLMMASGAPAQQEKRVRAPDFDGGVGWIGTDRPLKLQDFRGKFVVLDFWTLC